MSRTRRNRLDSLSRLHLHIFAVHLLIICLFSLPALLVQPQNYHLALGRLAALFSLSALSLVVAATLGRHRMLTGSLGLWDEVLALFALSLLCSILLRLVG